MTQDGLLEALRKALEQPADPDDAKTVWELMKDMGLADKAVRRRLRLAIEAGQVEAVTVTRTSMSGKPTSVPAYRLKAVPAGRSGADQ